jgi:hypothetical protein
MNKLKLLYDVAKVMKNQRKMDGVLQLNVRKDQEEVFSLRNKFEKNEAGRTKTTVSSKLDLEGKHVTRESVTEFDLQDHCHHGSGMLRRLFHGRHGAEGCCGKRSFFGKLAIAFGLLSSLKIEEKESGTAVVSLELGDIPEDLQATLLEKMQFKHDCLSQHGFLKERHKVETLKGGLVMTVNKERVIQTIACNLDGTATDENAGMHTMAAVAEVQFA